MTRRDKREDGRSRYSADGGLAVLSGNLAEDGCIVKTAGVDESIWRFEGPARIFESQEDACAAILSDAIRPGDLMLIRYEGPKGGPGMQEMLYPTSYLKAKKLGAVCALVTDGRFRGGTSGLSIGHVSPDAAEGGAIALVEEGDRVRIDIPERRIELLSAEAEDLRESSRDYAGMGEMLGGSPVMRNLFESLKRVAVTDATVLVTGETGTQLSVKKLRQKDC